MARKCPPGVFCIDNLTLFVIVCIVALIVYMFIKQRTTPNREKQNVVVVGQKKSPLFTNPNYVMSGQQNDIFLNPYAPPLKTNPFFPNVGGDARGIPINIPTSHYDLNYRQVGILTRTHGTETILALFGRPVHRNRNKWQYYTMTDKNNAIKLPVSKAGRSCSSEYGCDEIYNGDSIFVEGYNDAFDATVYENANPRYIPF